MNPTRTSAPSCIVFPPDASHFNFKPGIIQLLPSFHGLDLENPYLHLREFEEVCNTYNDSNCSMNTIRLKLFPFSLKDKAKTWLQNLRPGSIRAWDEMQQQFLKKFFLSHRTNSFKRQIICGGMYNLREDHDLQAKFASLATNIEALELKKSGQLKSVQDIVCQICETNDCPTLSSSFKECLHEQAHALNSFQRPNHNPYSQTYNPGWRNHLNFNWKSDNNNSQTS
jgi:hypothetical protein